MSVQKRIDYYRQRYAALRSQSADYRSHWKELAEFFAPRHGMYLTGESLSDNNDGKKKHSKIINGSALGYIRTSTAGLYSGCTPPTLPWFEFGLEDMELLKFMPVKEWLTDVRDSILGTFARSNFYDSIYNVYKELLVFGTNGMSMNEDFQNGLRTRAYTIGEFLLALGPDLRPAEMYRLFAMTAAQMVLAFGKERVSSTVWTAYENGNRDTKYNVLHVVEPNNDLVFGADGFRGMPWRSVYIEHGADGHGFLEEKGFHSQPFIAPRWSVVGGNTYGDSCGMDALGDQKQLQKMEQKKLKALDKSIDPPLNAPASLKNKTVSQIPGATNYVDNTSNNAVTAMLQIRPDFQAMLLEKEAVEKRIKGAFYNDLFLAVLGNDKTATATEIAKRYEEKLQVLGPELNRLYSEAFAPAIDRAYDILDRAGKLPPPPQELQGKNISVVFISTLARAQKLVNVGSIEQVVNFITASAQVNPEVLDKMDFDNATDKYIDSVGAPPSIIRPNDVVGKIRAARQKAQAQQAQMAMAQQGAETAKTMSQAKMGEGNALDKISEGGQQ